MRRVMPLLCTEFPHRRIDDELDFLTDELRKEKLDLSILTRCRQTPMIRLFSVSLMNCEAAFALTWAQDAGRSITRMSSTTKSWITI